MTSATSAALSATTTTCHAHVMDVPKFSLSQYVITALEGAVADACLDALSRTGQNAPYQYSDIPNVVLGVVHRAIAAFATVQNGNSMVMCLPEELLCAIFEHLPIRDRIAASHACSAWRGIMLGNPSIWSSFEYRGMKDGVLTHLLRRSRSADLQIELFVNRGNSAEVALNLRNHLHRCTRLHIVLDQKVRTRSVQHLVQALDNPALRMTSFQLHDRLNALRRVEYPTTELFRGSSPHLRLVKMHIDTLSWPPLPMAEDNTQILFCGVDGFSYPALQTLINRTQTCRGLGIEIDYWSEHETSRDILAVSDRLKELVIISNNSIFDPTIVLRHLEISAIPHVQVTFNENSDLATNVLAFLSNSMPVRSMRVNSVVDGAFNIDIWDGADYRQRQRLIQNSSVPCLQDASVFTQLTHLHVGELVLAMAHPVADMPALLELTIQTLMPKYQKDDGHDSIFMLPRTRECVLRCPALHTLRIGSRHHREVTRLAPDMICDFVEFHLEFSAPRLPRLVIRGLEILETIPAQASALLSLAEIFEVEEGFIQEPARCTEDLVNWV